MLLSKFAPVFILVSELKESEVASRSATSIKSLVSESLDKLVNNSTQSSRDPRDMDNARFAVTAWLDEVVMNMEGVDAIEWSSELLQKRLYGTTQAGELFFSKLKSNWDVVEVLEVYYACLCFGYKGKYGDSVAKEKLISIKESCRQKIVELRGGVPVLVENTKKLYKGSVPPPVEVKYRNLGRVASFIMTLSTIIVYFVFQELLDDLLLTAL